MTEFEKTTLTKQYEPLINKITNQFVKSGTGQWDDIKSMAYEGFAIAMCSYDATRSNMSFTQFAGFAIRNNILTCLNNELRTVKLSAYAQKKTTERGGTLFNSVSIDVINKDNTGKETNYKGVSKSADIMKLSQEPTFSDGNIFDTIYNKLEANFSPRDCEIFYRTFGLKNYNEELGKDIADSLGISRSLISVRLKRVISFIRKDEDLVEILANLLK
jgi:RNA polymerase sigma factor (sigma-70 family)